MKWRGKKINYPTGKRLSLNDKSSKNGNNKKTHASIFAAK